MTKSETVRSEAASSKFGVLLTTSLVSSLIMLDSNIVAVSLPAIARTFNASFTEIEWVLRAAALTAYAHGFAMVGLVAAGVASIACFLTYKLVRTSETAPKPVVGTETRPCLVPDCQTP